MIFSQSEKKGRSHDSADYDCPPLPLPFIEPSGWGEDAAQLCCPVCQFEYIHFDGVDELPGDDAYRNGWVRGDVVRIRMWCESGHQFALEFGFHKGNIALRVAPQWSNRTP